MIIDAVTGVIVNLSPADYGPGGWLAGGIIYDTLRYARVDITAPPHVVVGEWKYVNGGFRPVNFTAGELAAEKRVLTSQVLKIAKRLREKVSVGAHQVEVQGWVVKAAEAKAFANDPTDDTKFPMLKREALARGISVTALAAKVVAKRDAMINAEARIEGVRGKHKDAIKALSTIEELDAYNIRTGWPVI